MKGREFKDAVFQQFARFAAAFASPAAGRRCWPSRLDHQGAGEQRSAHPRPLAENEHAHDLATAGREQGVGHESGQGRVGGLPDRHGGGGPDHFPPAQSFEANHDEVEADDRGHGGGVRRGEDTEDLPKVDAPERHDQQAQREDEAREGPGGGEEGPHQGSGA